MIAYRKELPNRLLGETTSLVVYRQYGAENELVRSTKYQRSKDKAGESPSIADQGHSNRPRRVLLGFDYATLVLPLTAMRRIEEDLSGGTVSLEVSLND